MASNAADYRVEIERLLTLAQKLSAQRQHRIREAVRERHDADKALSFVRDTEAEDLGGRFLKALADADADLSPDQVRELESLIDAGLAHWP